MKKLTTKQYYKVCRQLSRTFHIYIISPEDKLIWEQGKQAPLDNTWFYCIPTIYCGESVCSLKSILVLAHEIGHHIFWGTGVGKGKNTMLEEVLVTMWGYMFLKKKMKLKLTLLDLREALSEDVDYKAIANELSKPTMLKPVMRMLEFLNAFETTKAGRYPIILIG